MLKKDALICPRSVDHSPSSRYKETPFFQKRPSEVAHEEKLITIIAYVDPGSGLLIWQMLVAAVVGCAFYLKKSREYLIKLLRKLLHRDQP